MSKSFVVGVLAVCSLVIVTGFGQVSHADLIVHLEFEGNFEDSSGNNVHGTPVGDTAIVSDSVRGNVASFDGDDDIISLDPADLIDVGADLLEEMTIAMWVNTSVDVSSTDFSGGFNTDWSEGGVHLKLNNGVVNIGINGGSGDVVGTTVIPVGEWHHIAFTGSLIDFVFAVYYDGVEEGIQAPTTTPFFFDMALNPSIGAWNNGGDLQREWNGFKDDFRLYNTALTPEEMQALFEETAPSGGSDVSEWSLHE